MQISTTSSDSLRVLPELVESLKSNLLISVSSNFIIALLAGWILLDSVPRHILAIWMITHIVLALFRILIVNRLYSLRLTQEKALSVKRWYTVVLLAIGLSWGATVLLASIYSIAVIQILMVMLIAGLTAGSVSTLTLVFSGFSAYFIGSLSLTFISMLMSSDSLLNTISPVVLMYMFIVFSSGKKLHDSQVTSLILTQELKVVASLPEENMEPVFRIDKNKKLLYSNPAGLKFLSKWSCHEGDIVPSFLGEPVDQVKIEKKSITFEYITDDGVQEFNVMPISNATYVNIYSRDITEHKMAESSLFLAKYEAEQASKAKSEFLASMGHQFRTPMSSILGFSQLLKSDSSNPLSNDQLDSLSYITESGEHLLKLIDDVLTLSDIQSGQVEASIDSININELFAQITTLIQAEAEKYSINVVNTVINEPAFMVKADYNKLQRILLNFASNAIKYNSENGTIILSCSQEDNGKVRLSVSDEGEGVSDEILHDLFEPFKRSEHADSAILGIGIGLTISKSLVDLMGGEIGVFNTPDKGATFWVEF